MIHSIRHTLVALFGLVLTGMLMQSTLKAQALELGTEYTDSFCVAAPKVLQPDTLNFQEERDSCIAMLYQIALENAREAWRDSVAEIIAKHINLQNCLGPA